MKALRKGGMVGTLVALVVLGWSLPAKALLFSGTAVGEWDSASVVEQSNAKWEIWNDDEDSGDVAKIGWGKNNGNFPKSVLKFDGAGSDDAIADWSGEADGSVFFLGDLYYRNGVQASGTGIKGVGLMVTVDILLPGNVNVGSFDFDLSINNTSNPNGDIILGLDPDPSDRSFLYGGGVYLFDVLGFSGNPGDAPIEKIKLGEGKNTTVNLYAKITTLQEPSQVPDGGSTIALLGIALLALGFRLRRVA